MRYIQIFGLLALLHLLAWAASHFYMEQNKREVLLVVDTSYSMKAKFGQVRRWLDDFEQDARYKKIVVGTDKAFLGALADLESREVVFRTAFGKLNADNLHNLYVDSEASHKYLLTDSAFDDADWEVVRF